MAEQCHHPSLCDLHLGLMSVYRIDSTRRRESPALLEPPKDITGAQWRENMELVAVFDFEGTHRKDPSLPPGRPQSVGI